MTLAKRKHTAKLAVAAGPAEPEAGTPKSFILQCREAAMLCYDAQVSAAMRAAADDLALAVQRLTVAVTPAAMTHLNCMWIRAVRAYTDCHTNSPTPPISSSATSPELDKAALAA